MIFLHGMDSPLDRALTIIEFVAAQSKAVSAAEIAKELHIPLPSAHRLLGNLEARSMIQKAPGTKRYIVGNRLVLLAGNTIGSAFRSARRHAVLQSVAREIGEQCEIGVIRNNAVAYVDSVRMAPVQGLQFDPGAAAPLYCTSTGKVYLSMLAPRLRRKLVETLLLSQHTENTITDTEVLLSLLETVRRQGWAKTNEEYVRGVVGCAVPILAPDRTLIACLGVSVPTARVSYEQLDSFIGPLTRAASLLSETILAEECSYSQ